MSNQIITRDFGTNGQLHFISTSSRGFANDCEIRAYFTEESAQQAISDTLNEGGYVQDAQRFAHHLPLDMQTSQGYNTALGMLDPNEID